MTRQKVGDVIVMVSLFVASLAGLLILTMTVRWLDGVAELAGWVWAGSMGMAVVGWLAGKDNTRKRKDSL